MGNKLTPLNSTILSSSQTSVTFNSISQSYTDLMLRIYTRGDGATGYSSYIAITFNGIVTGTYYRGLIYSDGAGTIAVQTSSSSYLYPTLNAISGGNPANVFSQTEIYIPNYSLSINRPVIGASTAIAGNSGTAYDNFSPMFFDNAAAVSSITVTAQGISNFVSGSRFDLYGLLKA